MNSQIPDDIMALLEELSQGGIAEDQNDLLAAQYKTADEMRKTKMPEMRSYGANHVVAPNPMEVAAAAIQQYRGGQQQRDSMDQMKGNVNTTGKGVRALMLAKLLRDYQKPPQGPAPVAPVEQGPVPWLSEEPYTPGMGAPGQEGPDITEGRPPLPRKPKMIPPPPRAGSTGATETW